MRCHTLMARSVAGNYILNFKSRGNAKHNDDAPKANHVTSGADFHKCLLVEALLSSHPITTLPPLLFIYYYNNDRKKKANVHLVCDVTDGIVRADKRVSLCATDWDVKQLASQHVACTVKSYMHTCSTHIHIHTHTHTTINTTIKIVTASTMDVTVTS